MAIGQRMELDELSDVDLAQLYETLGERDTARLFAEPYRVDVSYDIPFGAGNSVDRKTKYVDRGLYREVMDGEFKATGLDPQQIIDRWLDHEHCEKCVVDGDNPVDIYPGAHVRGLAKEHEGVLAILGHANALTKIRTYETVIWPGLQRCYNRPVQRVPKDLWVAPLMDEPDDRDRDILKRMVSLGVIDASKRSKYDTHYGIAEQECHNCTMWRPDKLSQENGKLAFCTVVTGLARENRHCDFFKHK